MHPGEGRLSRRAGMAVGIKLKLPKKVTGLLEQIKR